MVFDLQMCHTESVKKCINVVVQQALFWLCECELGNEMYFVFMFALLWTYPTVAFLEAYSQKGFEWIFQRKGVKRVKVTYSSPNLKFPEY